MRIPDDIGASLPDVAKQVALPAILAGAGTGALSAYMSSRSRPANENPAMRRRRILRNALVGTLLGGTAGATLPMGVKMLTEPMFGAPTGVDPIHQAMGFGLRHAAPIAAGVGGGMYLGKLRSAEKARAMSSLFGQLKGHSIGGTKIVDPAHLTALLEAGNRDAILKALATQGRGDAVSSLLGSHQLLGEAGYKGNVLGRLGSGSTVWGKMKTAPGGMQEAIRQYIRSQSIMPGGAKGLGLAGWMSRAHGGEVAGRSTTPLAEAYLNFVRPAAKRMVGRRTGNLGRLGMLGGGVLIAKELQDALTGNQ